MKHLLFSTFFLAALAIPAAAPVIARANDAVASKESAEKSEPVIAVHTFAYKGDDGGDYAVTLRPGQSLRIVLSDNGAGTGCAWFLTDATGKEELATRREKGWTCANAKAGVLTLAAAPQFTSPDNHGKPGMGKAGTLSWSFSAKAEGRQTLRFAFRHAWEKAGPTDLIVTYAVTVAGAARSGVEKISGTKKNGGEDVRGISNQPDRAKIPRDNAETL